MLLLLLLFCPLLPVRRRIIHPSIHWLFCCCLRGSSLGGREAGGGTGRSKSLGGVRGRIGAAVKVRDRCRSCRGDEGFWFDWCRGVICEQEQRQEVRLEEGLGEEMRWNGRK